MRICKEHWQMMRDSIDEHGMTSLVAKSGEEAMENTLAEFQGQEAPFDPLMSMHWHWTNSALHNGGLYLLGLDENGKEYCPVCEFMTHLDSFVNPKKEIDDVSKEMVKYCREKGLIPRVS